MHGVSPETRMLVHVFGLMSVHETHVNTNSVECCVWNCHLRFSHPCLVPTQYFFVSLPIVEGVFKFANLASFRMCCTFSSKSYVFHAGCMSQSCTHKACYTRYTRYSRHTLRTCPCTIMFADGPLQDYPRRQWRRMGRGA